MRRQQAVEDASCKWPRSARGCHNDDRSHLDALESEEPSTHGPPASQPGCSGPGWLRPTRTSPHLQMFLLLVPPVLLLVLLLVQQCVLLPK